MLETEEFTEFRDDGGLPLLPGGGAGVRATIGCRATRAEAACPSITEMTGLVTVGTRICCSSPAPARACRGTEANIVREEGSGAYPSRGASDNTRRGGCARKSGFNAKLGSLGSRPDIDPVSAPAITTDSFSRVEGSPKLALTVPVDETTAGGRARTTDFRGSNLCGSAASGESGLPWSMMRLRLRAMTGRRSDTGDPLTLWPSPPLLLESKRGLVVSRSLSSECGASGVLISTRMESGRLKTTGLRTATPSEPRVEGVTPRRVFAPRPSTMTGRRPTPGADEARAPD